MGTRLGTVAVFWFALASLGLGSLWLSWIPMGSGHLPTSADEALIAVGNLAVIPFVPGVIGLLQAYGLLSPPRALLTATIGVVMAVAAVLTGFSFSVGFEAADAGAPMPFLGRITGALALSTWALGATTTGLTCDGLLSASRLHPALRPAVSALLGIVATPFLCYALIQPLLMTGCSGGMLLISILPHGRRLAGSSSPAGHAAGAGAGGAARAGSGTGRIGAPAPMVGARAALPAVPGSSTPSPAAPSPGLCESSPSRYGPLRAGPSAHRLRWARILGACTVLAGIGGIACIILGGVRGAPVGSEGSVTTVGVQIALLSALPVLAALGLLFTGRSAGPSLHIWGPVGLMGVFVVLAAAAYLWIPVGAPQAPMLIIGAAIGGIAVAWAVIAHLPLPAARRICLGLTLGVVCVVCGSGASLFAPVPLALGVVMACRPQSLVGAVEALLPAPA